jgi:3-phosphoshikimate 1-carboxyvinyltransferase
MAVMAALAEGQSMFDGISRARIKETDRVSAVKEGLLKIGVDVVEQEDRLIITGMKEPDKPAEESEEESGEEAAEAKPAEEEPEKKELVVINSHGDHRIAMAFGVMGAALGNIIIEGAECVTKTFPGFWEAFESVGGNIKRDG